MEQTSLSPSDIRIPKNLEKWVVAYQKIDKNEYDFYLKNFPLSRIRIRASRVKMTQKYIAESNYKLRYPGSRNRFNVPHGVSENPIRAMYICLESLITKERIFSFERNRAYPGTPIID